MFIAHHRVGKMKGVQYRGRLGMPTLETVSTHGTIADIHGMVRLHSGSQWIASTSGQHDC